MLVKLTESVTLAVPPEQCWKLLRDTQQFAALIPGVESVTPAPANEKSSERYSAQIVEKVGPFRLKMKMEVAVVEAVEPSRLRAELSGGDFGGGNRVSGTLVAELKPVEASSTLLSFDSSVEVLGKLASLGAVPIRRRATELFAHFAERVKEKFSAATPQTS